METEIRCSNDNTLLVTFVRKADGTLELRVPSPGRELHPKDVPGNVGLRSIWVVCPVCGKENFAGTMPVA